MKQQKQQNNHITSWILSLWFLVYQQTLGKTNDTLIGKVIAAQAKLPPTRISKDGSIREWAEDFEDPEVHHRHVSHLFGLFPGHTITVEKSPELAKAVEATLKKRGLCDSFFSPITISTISSTWLEQYIMFH